MEEKDLQEKKEAALKEIDNVATQAAEKKIAEFNATVEKALESAEKRVLDLEDKVAKQGAEQKKQSQIKQTEKMEKMTMVDAFKDAIKSNHEQFKNFDGDSKIMSKALEAADFGVGGYDLVTTEVKGVYNSPYAPIWLRNIFPTTTATGQTIKYLQKDTPTGGADIFTRGTDERKATYKPKYKVATAIVETIAVTADVPTEMIQDVGFIADTIPKDLVYSEAGILARENKKIMDYIEANAIDFSKDADFAINLEKVLGAGYGQILSKYMQPTHILINNWDYLKALAFNKASGSGEYDTVQMFNGSLYINGLIAVPIPTVREGFAYVVAANESQFVQRMNPEVRMFEQNKDNVETNMVTFRAEERMAFYTKDFNSLVKVAFTYPKA